MHRKRDHEGRIVCIVDEAGYIRGAQMYLDAPGGWQLLSGVVTDENGNFFIANDANPNGYALVAVGGVNIDTGLPNTSNLKAPAGSSTINPLTTLVAAVMASTGSTDALAAATQVASALGLSLTGQNSLLNYDPIKNNDTSIQKAAAQVATIVALAEVGAGNGAEATVVSNLAIAIRSAATASTTISLADAPVLSQALSGVSLSAAAQSTIADAVAAISTASSVTAISAAQSLFLDTIAPDAPTALSVASVTNDATPTVRVSLNARSLDGKAAVVGDKVTLMADGIEVGTVTLVAANLTNGFVDVTASVLAEGSHTFTAKLLDQSGKASQASVSTVSQIDTLAPTFGSGATATAINENSGAGQVVYTAASTDTGVAGTAYSLKSTGDYSLLSINASTGAVALSGNPNFENKSTYAFTVIATDLAGNVSEKSVTLAINNLDEVAPIISSNATATDIAENSGANQVVYKATSTDSADISAGVTYSLKANTGDVSAFSINASTGDVTLTGNPNFEAKSNYTFTVVATDAAGNASEKVVTLGVTDVAETSTLAIGNLADSSVAENVAYTSATPSLTGAIGAVTWTLEGADAAKFTVNASTGVVSMVARDFEAPADAGTNNVYNYTLKATDADGNVASQAVAVTVTDVTETASLSLSGVTATASVAENVAYTSATPSLTGAICLVDFCWLRCCDDCAGFCFVQCRCRNPIHMGNRHSRDDSVHRGCADFVFEPPGLRRYVVGAQPGQ